MAGILLWSLWKTRNNVVFGDAKFNTDEVLFRARSMIKEWDFRNELNPDGEGDDSQTRFVTKSYLVRWHSPPIGHIKINFDGSVREEEATAEYVIRDHTGKLIKAGATKLGKISVLVAEAIGLRNGIQAAFDLGLRRLCIEGDNTCVIQALRGEIITPWSISNIIKDTCIFLSKCKIVSISHIFKKETTRQIGLPTKDIGSKLISIGLCPPHSSLMKSYGLTF